MKLAITPNNLIDDLILFDTETKEEHRIKAALPKGEYRPYGITWNKDNIFIASKFSLLIYNSNLELIDIRRNILDYNTHQILVHGDELIVCMTTRDCLKFINLNDFSERLWHPKWGWMDKVKYMKEIYHINTVIAYDDNIYAMLHHFGGRASQIVSLDGIVQTIDARASHNIYLDGDTLGYIDTYNNRLVIGDQVTSCDLWHSRRMFLRGLAGDNKELIVGCSNRNERRTKRMEGDSFISVVKEGEVQSNIKIIGTGDIDDIRRIDGPDLCHHNPHPFPCSKF